MKTSSVAIALSLLLIMHGSARTGAAEPAAAARLAVLEMQEIPAGTYELQLELGGQTQTVRVAIKGTRATFVKAGTSKLEGFAGEFEFIGNGVFMARLAGRNHRATQWWLFRPDGTAVIKEIPDRGEKQTAKPVVEK